MAGDWIKITAFDPRYVIDGRMPLGMFAERLESFGEWIVIRTGPRWYAGSKAEFLEALLPTARASSSVGGDSPIGEALETIGIRGALYINRGGSLARVKALLEVRGRYDWIITRGVFGKLVLWERPGRKQAEPYRYQRLERLELPMTSGAAGDALADDVFASFHVRREEADTASLKEGVFPEGVLAAEAAAPDFPELDPDEPGSRRWINAVLEDHDADEPLVYETSYVLAISIDPDESTSIGAVAASPASDLTRDTDADIRLTVTLASEDFDISERQRPLKISKAGLSVGKARFDIQPKIKKGSGRLTGIIHRDNNFVQQLDIVLEVGEKTPMGSAVRTIGRPVEAARTLSPRNIGLMLRRSPHGQGYECTTWGATSSDAHLPISDAELAQNIDNVRQALLRVVMARDSNDRSPFQEKVAIDADVSKRGLQVIAKAGYLLFRSLFFHPAADTQCQNLGAYLVEEVTNAQEGFKLQVVANDFPVPWSLLYLTDAWDEAAVKWEGFLGSKLVIEQIPQCNDRNRRDTRIPGRPDGLAVSLNFNSDIDAQFNSNFVETQQAYWRAVQQASPSINAVIRTSKADLIHSLSDGALSDQIIYFYCHAESVGLGVGGGPGQSKFIMSGDEMVSLDDLNLDAPTQKKLRGAPLVFINACESGRLSPLFYNGFVPYFLSKGARGVIGTECKVPALFAVEWAKEFFDEFLRGATIGETVLKLRNDFFYKNGNPLGLLYGIHCNADTQIQPLP